MYKKFENKNHRHYSNKRDNLQTFKGSIHYPNQVHIPNQNNACKFQVNNFDNLLCFRFNLEFVKMFLSLHSQATNPCNSEFANNLIDDLTEITKNKDECFVTDEYHVGVFSDVIYLNLNKKYFNDICTIISSFSNHPPAIFKLRELLFNMHFFVNETSPKKAENF